MEKRTREGKDNIKRVSAGGVVFKGGKKKKASGVLWLIIQPSGTKRWQLPKGAKEKSETLKECAKREVKEETGIVAKVLTKVADERYEYIYDGNSIFQTVAFYLMSFVKDTNTFYKNEIEEVKMVSFENALDLLTYDNDKEVLQKARNHLRTNQDLLL